MTIKNHRLVLSPMSRKPHLIRVGKDRGLALEKRDCEQDLYFMCEEICGETNGEIWSFTNQTTGEKYEIHWKKLPVDSKSEHTEMEI